MTEMTEMMRNLFWAVVMTVSVIGMELLGEFFERTPHEAALLVTVIMFASSIVGVMFVTTMSTGDIPNIPTDVVAIVAAAAFAAAAAFIVVVQIDSAVSFSILVFIFLLLAIVIFGVDKAYWDNTIAMLAIEASAIFVGLTAIALWQQALCLGVGLVGLAGLYVAQHRHAPARRAPTA